MFEISYLIDLFICEFNKFEEIVDLVILVFFLFICREKLVFVLENEGYIKKLL